MESRRFDYLVHSFATLGTRRRVLRIVAALPLAARLLVTLNEPAVAAGRKARHRRSRRRRDHPSHHKAHQQRDVHGEGCLAAGQRCPQKKGKGKRAKKLGCNRCCDGFTSVDSSGQNVCGCLSDGTSCTPEIASSCCSGFCDGSTCQAARCSSDSPCPACQTCRDGVCAPVADGTTCDDGDACTLTDTCQGGRCMGSNHIICPASANPCLGDGVCNRTTGTCSNPAKPEGTICNDGNLCTQNDTCLGGVCVGGNPVVCPTMPPVCQTSTCNPNTGTCNVANGTACSDDKVCCNGTCCTGCCTSNGSCGSCTVFVTSTTHDGNLIGLTGADGICQNLATSHSLPGTYKAWLSDSLSSPSTRFRRSGMPYTLVNTPNPPVASSWGDLVDGSLSRKIDLDETGVFVGSEELVWTETTGFGMAGNGNTCTNWTSTSASNKGQVGLTGKANSEWTASTDRDCNLTARLYCFQQQ